MEAIKRFILDLQLTQSQIAVEATQGDTAREWHISFSDGGNEYILPAGTRAEIDIKRPSQTFINTDCDILNNRTVVYKFYKNDITRDTANVVGVHTCNITLYDVNGEVIASPKFTFIVRKKNVSDDDKEYTDEQRSYHQSIVIAENARKNAEDARVVAENARATSEANRVIAEQARVTAESLRVGAENLRVATIRDLNEKVERGDFKGDTGADGSDGFSPTVNVEELSGGLGYKITITDINGDKSFFVYNGKTGEAGTVARYTVDMELDNSTYKLKLMLTDEVGNVVSEDTVDFPIEEMVVGADEKNGTITLTLKNGNTTSFYIGDLVDGLVSQKDFDAWKNAVPTITTTQVTDGYKVTFTDKNGSKEIVLKNGAKGDPGTPGTPGTPGADGKDYVLTDTDKDEIADKVAGRVKGEAIIDVVELPSEDVDTKRFYRVPVGTFFHGKTKNDWTCIVVDTLPDDALPVTTDMVNVTLYYDMSSGNAQGYANDMLSGAFGIPVGWYPMEVVCQLMGTTWNGIVFDESDVPEEDSYSNKITLLILTKLYQATDNNGVIDFDDVGGSVGWKGNGYGAEVFNSLFNEAKGVCSHAEGFCTVAEGENSHAEGCETGAEGNFSHAEGRFTVARGDYQHAQGCYNIPDDEHKYAHIIGNGFDGTPSNAHTIDWQGNGWFAGTIKVGGTGQDDENAKEVATKEYVNLKTPQLVAGDNLEAEYDEDEHTLTVKLKNGVYLKGNYPLSLSRKTTEHQGVAYIVPPALADGTMNLYIPSKSGTIALLQDLEGFEDRKDGLSTYLYNGVFDTTSLSWFEPEANPTIDISDINIPTGRTLQVGDLLIDTVGTVAYVHYIYLNTVEYVVKMSLNGGGSSSGGGSAEAVSKIGTWTVVDDPVIPVSELPLKFTSNGGEYTYIGTGTTGPDQWGIRNLRYCNGDTNENVMVYTNNPSESYGITHGWSNEAYKTITITEEPTNRHVIDWLENNTDAPRGKDTCLLPSFNVSNEGQFLRIVNGVPEWVTITSAEGSGF